MRSLTLGQRAKVCDALRFHATSILIEPIAKPVQRDAIMAQRNVRAQWLRDLATDIESGDLG